MLLKHLKRRNFEELMAVTESGDQVTILMKEGARSKKELIITVDGEEDVVVYLRGRFEMEDFLKNGNFKVGSVNLNKPGKKVITL